ncbi:hypothetical protein [Parabacteroides sp. PF5-6]|uniref:hypothetical protein n=1 Tax=Parabacteroides sp. PF5-6 TaxID=1742403 RepID=UPI00240547A9|nr:hypothetical protein [Parabacteroides sp. PF5-6]MDF9831496.1 hypothetical protein [Parabacteroides sp. PF5-6]
MKGRGYLNKRQILSEKAAGLLENSAGLLENPAGLLENPAGLLENSGGLFREASILRQVFTKSSPETLINTGIWLSGERWKGV